MKLPDKSKTGTLTYADSGVDIDAGNALVEAIKPMAQSTSRAGGDGKLGGFGGLFDLKAAGFIDPVLVAANDGVGTKVKIAIETGIHNSIGIDLVAMCVNDLIVQGAEPLFFLDYYSCGKLKINEAKSVISGIAEGCRQAGAALIGGETAEMPGLYSDGDYDLAGFAVGAVERNKILPSRNITRGDVLIALQSSGAHSNGFSLIRRLVSDLGLDWTESAPFSPDQTLGQALLTPTRIYVQPILKVLKKGNEIKAIAHITGGGLTENLPRILPEGISASIDLSKIVLPPVFRWLAESGNMEPLELLRTFNCGVGMISVASPEHASNLLTEFQNQGETASVIGEIIEDQEDRKVFYVEQARLLQ